MKKTAIALGLVGILAGNISRAQTLETENPKIEIQQQNKSSLDSLVKIYNTPAAIQRFTAQNIEYIKNAEKFYPGVNKNSAPEGFIRFPSPEKILDKKYGDCEEGFILTAAALKKLGYETMGLAMNPKNGKPGHIFTIYKDTLTNLYGTAGISTGDYISPVYDSIDDLIAGLALKSKYHDFRITAVEVNDNILNNSNHVDLPKKYVKDMSLTDIFGVLFKTENCKFGELEQDIYDDGYRITLGNTIIEPKNPVGRIRGPIKELAIRNDGKKTSIHIGYTNNHRYSTDMVFTITQKNPNTITFFKHDRASLSGLKIDQYSFNKQTNTFEDMPKKESQEYIDLTNYFLKLLKNDETKELWEQTKKQREIKKAQQNSLQLPNKD